MKIPACSCGRGDPTDCLIHGQTVYYDSESANRELDQMRTTFKTFRAAAKMAGLFCSLRRSGFCYLDCDARAVCDVSWLTPLTWRSLPSEFKEALSGM